MLISIVSGTYNRLNILQQMIKSIRIQMYPGMTYEIILVDGGSTDGTQEWAKSQPDIRLIEHGQLVGAIRAFCDGARAANGQYVIMANDDIEFGQYSILSALAHLEDNPNCGGVAFADNRYRRDEHRVMYHPARDVHGQSTFAPFAQVGMFRRELGTMAGWWGDADPVMSQARTYGGDNYLSSRLWEMGYTIETCPQCIIHDLIERDELRVINAQSGERDSRLYYSRFEGGAMFGSLPYHMEHDSGLRILYLPIFEGNHPQQKAQKRGLRDALSVMGTVLEYDYGYYERQGVNIADDLYNIVSTFRPHVLLTQFQGVPQWSVEAMRKMRSAHPAMLCLNWNGDYWPEVQLSDQMIGLLQWFDLALCVNLNVLPVYAEQGIRAAYWQVASEEPTDYPEMPAYDVLFLGNCYSEYRKELEPILRSLPYRVGIYGRGWQQSDGDTLYDFAKSHSLITNATICIGDNQYPDGSAFVSNRFFETLHAGGFLLHQAVPKLYQATGLRAGQHYASFDDLSELPDKIDYWMKQVKRRETIRKRGQQFAHNRHTFHNRVEELFLELIPEYVGKKVYA